jgi:hypothetical protein
MDKDKILNMEAGEEMDTLIAEKVMGWHIETENSYKRWVDINNRFCCGFPSYDGLEDDEDFHTLKWHPSGSILWAWDVVEKSNSFSINNCISQEEGVDGVRRWTAEVFFEKWGLGEAETAPLAICRAALCSVMGNE